MSFLVRALFGSGQEELTDTELVEKLCERVVHARLLQDKLDALANLKLASKNYKEEVGRIAMPLLCSLLLDKSQPYQLTIEVLEIMRCLICFEQSDRQDAQRPFSYDMIVKFTESLVREEIVNRLMDILQDSEYKLRLNSIIFLSTAMRNCPRFTSRLLSSNASSISIMISLIDDLHEGIRNEAILLLSMLARNNRTARQVIAFESGFEKVLSIVAKEAGMPEGIIVNDCLNLVHTLLTDDRSNQELFLQNQCLKIVASLLTRLQEEKLSEISEMSLKNLLLLLRIVSSACQREKGADCSHVSACLQSTGIIDQMCKLATNEDTPVTAKIESFSTLGSVARMNQDLQSYLFSKPVDESTPPRTFFYSSILQMISPNQPGVLKCAVLYCLAGVMFGNSSVYQDLCSDNQQQLRCILHDALFKTQFGIPTWAILLMFSHGIDTWLINSESSHNNRLFGVYAIEDLTKLYSQAKEVPLALAGLLAVLFHWLVADEQSADSFATSQALDQIIMTFVEFDIFDTNEAQSKANSEMLKINCRPVVNSLCALILSVCLVQSGENSRVYTVIKEQIGLPKLVNAMESLATQPCFKQGLTKIQPAFSLTVGLDERYILMDNTIRLYQSVQASLIRRVCGIYGVSFRPWLFEDAFIDESSSQPAEIPTHTESIHAQLDAANEEIAHWRAFYQQYQVQQKEMFSQFQAMQLCNEQMQAAIAERDKTIEMLTRQQSQQSGLWKSAQPAYPASQTSMEGNPMHQNTAAVEQILIETIPTSKETSGDKR